MLRQTLKLTKLNKVTNVVKSLRKYTSEVMSDEKTFEIHSKCFYAAAKGDVEKLTELLQENPSLSIDRGDYDYRTPLHLAASEGKKKNCIQKKN
jgi:ankyrin repeat protein